MGTSKIGMEELLPQKWCHKNNLNCISRSEKLTALIQLKKLSEELNNGISTRYLINTQLSTVEW